MSRIHDNTVLKSVVAHGEKSLWNSADALFPGWIQVLDIIHVRDKLCWFPIFTVRRKALKHAMFS
jgi:hypothetical protein